MKPIYLDYNATTPIDPLVAEAMMPFLHNHFGNPSSSHIFGATAKKAVEKARKQTSEMLGCDFDEIVFTSGGSESNNYAIKGAAFAHRHKGNHIITLAIEHPAVLNVCAFLETKGFEVTYLPVDEFGLVDPELIEESVKPQTILITIMHANNEVGTIEPIRDIAEIARRHGILFHTDCAQSIGKIPVRIDDLGVDLLSVAGHKFYAPKGVGALYIRHGTKLEKQVHGASHEMDLRAGTENVLEVVGLGEACALVQRNLPEYQQHLSTMRNQLEQALLERFPSTKLNGHPQKRLPNTTSLSFKGLEANTILSELSNIAASAGAACHSDQVDISHVLKAMKVPVEYAMGTVRLSVGRFTTSAEIDSAVEEISHTVEKLRSREAPIIVETSDEIHLTQFTHGLGCACKLRPQLLEQVLKKMPVYDDSNILVGADTSDDAAVYRLDDHTAIVQTVDFFTPIVDDPFRFGEIAASNSLSDIYAMGAKPLFALNVVGFPSNRLPLSVLEQILQGACAKASEAGIAIIGGHTIDDTEPKFGLAVTGVVDPQKIVKNNSARPGDVLVLTKPLGTGILSTALKQKLLDDEQQALLIRTMSALNRDASKAMQKIGVNACTDVTGFGLLGHLLEMMQGSSTTAELAWPNVPFLAGARELAASGIIPGGTRDNYAYTSAHVRYNEKLSETHRLLLNDAQTSGGLLISLPENKVGILLDALTEKGIPEAVVVGRVVERQELCITVT
jgi:cysteine desulfurase